MLMGFVDFVFEYEGCYYVFDYKFNVLGDDDVVYIIEVLEVVMVEYCYDV